jgi:hypothetical protein
MEKNHTLDIGTDFGFLTDRITGSFAYFYKKTFDLLQNFSYNKDSGFSSVPQNLGVVVKMALKPLNGCCYKNYRH